MGGGGGEGLLPWIVCAPPPPPPSLEVIGVDIDILNLRDASACVRVKLTRGIGTGYTILRFFVASCW